MRVRNISGKTTSVNYIVALVFFLFFLFVDFLIYLFSTDLPLSFGNFFNWLFQTFKLNFDSNNDSGLVYALLFIAPIAFLFLFIHEYLVRKSKINKINKDLNLKYVDFKDDNIFFKFNHSENDFMCSYEQLSSVDLEICTRQACSRYGAHSIVSELIIEINVQNQTKHKLHNIPKNIYNVIKYLAKSKNFHYKITGSGFDLKETLTKNIDEILTNGLQKTNSHKQLLTFYLIFSIIFLGLGIMTSICGIFTLIFDNHMWGLLLLPILFFGVPICLLSVVLRNR